MSRLVFNIFKDRDSHNLSGKPVPVFNHCNGKKNFLISNCVPACVAALTKAPSSVYPLIRRFQTEVQFPFRYGRAQGTEDKRNAHMFYCTQNTKGLNQESDREEEGKICVYTAGCEHTQRRCTAGRDMSRTYTPVFGAGKSLCPNGLSLYISGLAI